jgi:RpiR family carbohydrate utilization transcriptional regulator
MDKQSQPTEALSYCIPLIRGRYPSLARSEQKVAKYILSHPAEVVNMSSIQLGSEVGVSESTVVKCCQRLGFEGFSHLKMALVRDLATTPASAFGEVEPDDSIGIIKEKVFQTNAQALSDTLKVLSDTELEKAVEMIENAGKLGFFGVGASGLVAHDAQSKFMRIGIEAEYHQDTHTQMIQAALMQPGDAAIVITHSGETLDAAEVLRLAYQAGAHAICVTNHPDSTAGRLAEVVLLTSAHETDLRSGAMASRIAQLAIIDALFMSVAIHRHKDSMSYLVKTRQAVSSRKGKTHK